MYPDIRIDYLHHPDQSRESGKPYFLGVLRVPPVIPPCHCIRQVNVCAHRCLERLPNGYASAGLTTSYESSAAVSEALREVLVCLVLWGGQLRTGYIRFSNAGTPLRSVPLSETIAPAPVEYVEL